MNTPSKPATINGVDLMLIDKATSFL